MKIVGEIPARMGSQRVKKKNLRLLDGRPLITYAINAAKNAQLVDEVYVNSDSDILGRLAIENGVKVYKRSEALASDDAKQEEFNYDFLKNVKADVLVMINPVSPLISSADVDNAIQFYLDHDYDTVITVEELKQQAFCEGKPININPHEILQATQTISPIHLCTWSITIWKTKTFIELFESKNYGAFGGKLGFFPMSREKCLKISYEEDFRLVESILKSKEIEPVPIRYYIPNKQN